MWDERDRAVKRRTWALAGKAAFTFLFVVSAVLAHPDGIPVYAIIVVSARFYYDRTV